MPDPERTYQHPEDREAVERFDYEGGAMQGVEIPKDAEKTNTPLKTPREKKQPQKNR